MLKYVYSIVILAHLVYAQDGFGEYENSVSETWSNDTGYNEDLNAYCVTDCERKCTNPCPVAQLCSETEKQCGQVDLPEGVWPDCTKDDICVNHDCECQTEGKDGSLCPLWCETYCSETTQIKCTGKKDDNNCLERDVCINRPVGNDGQLCAGYCPVECEPVKEHKCSTPPDNGCPLAPTCNTKATNKVGEYCEEQHCQLVCETTHKFCAGEQMVDGCYEADECVPKDISDAGALCDGNCPITCDPVTEILCDGTTIYHGPKAGCKNDDSCAVKARDVTGQYCNDNSDSHGCPITCEDDEHLCPTRTHADNCKEQATCTPCSKDNEGNCCPPSSDCPALCQPHEVECQTGGEDTEGCALPSSCIVQERDFYGELCSVHCPGTCNTGQILCPGGRDDTGCVLPPTCQPLATKLWGEDKGGWCPGFCPVDCQDWEILCSSVQDPCDGCPTEPVCKPRAKNDNGVNCPTESASHDCDISCKTLEGENTICAAYEETSNPGCKQALICLARTTGTDGNVCPAHSVCPKQCQTDEIKCSQGFDDNDCKESDLCVKVPRDEKDQPCMDFACPVNCDEEAERYCAGQDAINENGQLCPLASYCADRPLDNNGYRCSGHCTPACGAGMVVDWPTGGDIRGCPIAPVCLLNE